MAFILLNQTTFEAQVEAALGALLAANEPEPRLFLVDTSTLRKRDYRGSARRLIVRTIPNGCGVRTVWALRPWDIRAELEFAAPCARRDRRGRVVPTRVPAAVADAVRRRLQESEEPLLPVLRLERGEAGAVDV